MNLASLFADRSTVVLLVQLQNPDGSPAYAYLAVQASKVPDFLTQNAAQPVDLEAWGVVLARGDGAYPPDEVREWIMEEFGFES